MVKSEYDPKRELYTVVISKQELEEAFKSRETYRDFLLKNFGFHLTLEDLEEVEE